MYCTRVASVLSSCCSRMAMISRILKIIGLFCKRALWKRRYSARETYNFKEPTNRSHPFSPPQRCFTKHVAVCCIVLQCSAVCSVVGVLLSVVHSSLCCSVSQSGAVCSRRLRRGALLALRAWILVLFVLCLEFYNCLLCNRLEHSQICQKKPIRMKRNLYKYSWKKKEREIIQNPTQYGKSPLFKSAADFLARQICRCMHTYMYIYTCICIYIHIHTYMNI